MNQPKTNPQNDRIKREYLLYLREARQRSAATVEQVRHAIDRLEVYTGYKDFGTFNKEQARAFKRTLSAARGQHSGKPLSPTTVHHVLQAVKEFLVWLHGRAGYRSRISIADIAYLNLSANEERAARTGQPRSYATLDQYRVALFAMPTTSEYEKRDQALVALLLLTGMRDTAAISLKLKHVSIERRRVFQDPREVRTKFAKAIETYFFRVGDDIELIFFDWLRYLTSEKLFGPNDPLFPKTAVQQDAHYAFQPHGLTREHWANASPVRQIFRSAFTRVGLPYVKPHSVRNTLTQFAFSLQLNPEQLKAWAQNLGHDSVLTTIGSYGAISTERQAEIIRGLRAPPPANKDLATEIAEKVAAFLKN